MAKHLKSDFRNRIDDVRAGMLTAGDGRDDQPDAGDHGGLTF